MKILIRHIGKYPDVIFPLRYFNMLHITMCIVPILIFVAMYLILRKKNNQRREKILFWVSIANILLFIAYKIAMAIMYKPFIVWEHLPLQLCNINLILLPIALKTRNKYICNYLYYMGIWGAYCGVVFFDTYFHGRSGISFIVIAYFVYHGIIASTCLYMAVGKIFTPTKDMILKSLVVLFAFGAVMLCLNIFLRESGICKEANYFYTMGMRGNPVLGRMMKMIPIPLLYSTPLLPIIYLFDFLIYLPFKNK